MLKLMKYELRKMRTGILILLGIWLAAEALFLFGRGGSTDTAWLIALILMIYGFFGSLAFAFFRGSALYGRELREKSGYLLFMTPNSALKILSAKVLTGLLMAAAFIALYGAALAGNLSMAEGRSGIAWSEFGLMLRTISMTNSQFSYMIGISVLMAIATFLSTSAALYFSQTLSATILEGKKGRGGLTLLFWIMISTAAGWLNDWTLGLEQGLVPLPLLLHAALGALGIWGSARLLEKKVSL